MVPARTYCARQARRHGVVGAGARRRARLRSLAQSDERVLIRASFEKSKLDKDTLQNLIALLEEYGLSDTLRSMKVSDIPREDWLAKWKEGFEPFRVGTQFVVCPIWRRDAMTSDLTDGRKVILIDPGLAFGTGLHTTTQFCLRALEAYKPEGMVLDVGTGTGILAIACKLLNPDAKVIGIDNDPVAIETAQSCLAVNNLENQVELRLGSTECVADMQIRAFTFQLDLRRHHRASARLRAALEVRR